MTDSRDDRPSRPRTNGSGAARDGSRGSSGRGGDSSRSGQGRQDEKRLWTKGGAPARGDRSAREREPEVDRDPFGTRSVRARHEDPEIP